MYQPEDELSQRHKEKEQNNSSCDHVLDKARVCTSHPHIPSQRMWRSWADGGGGLSDL